MLKESVIWERIHASETIEDLLKLGFELSQMPENKLSNLPYMIQAMRKRKMDMINSARRLRVKFLRDANAINSFKGKIEVKPSKKKEVCKC